MFPVWIALLSWPLTGTAPTLGTWIAVVCGVLGVVLVQQPHLAEGNFAALVALASSFSTSIAMLGLHRLHQIDPRAIVVHFSAVSTLACVLALAFFDRSLASDEAFGPWVLLGLLGLGISATTGQLFLTKAFAAGPPAQVSVVGLTQVAFGVLFDVAIWRRPISLMSLLGMVLVVTPTAWLILRQNESQTDDL
jgi:drug/metabolite transporter (DMT)-like permease